MPRRAPFHDFVLSSQPAPVRDSVSTTEPGLGGAQVISPHNLQNSIEHLRQGTREQWESPWTQIQPSGSFAFPHDLGEVPWVVDVIGSLTTDGKFPLDHNADVTVAKTDTTVTVTNNLTSALYFKARAM